MKPCPPAKSPTSLVLLLQAFDNKAKGVAICCFRHEFMAGLVAEVPNIQRCHGVGCQKRQGGPYGHRGHALLQLQNRQGAEHASRVNNIVHNSPSKAKNETGI